MSNAGSKPAYVDDPRLGEVFADRVTAVGFDGGNIRLELAVTRIIQESGRNDSAIHPVVRLVLPLNAVNELMQKLGGSLAELEKQGIVRKGSVAGPKPGPDTRN